MTDPITGSDVTAGHIQKGPCPCASLDFCRYTKIGNWRVCLGEKTEGPEGVSCLPCGLAPKRLKKKIHRRGEIPSNLLWVINTVLTVPKFA